MKPAGRLLTRAMVTCLAGCALATGAMGAPPGPARVSPGPCEVGAALALVGNLALAESVFVSLLSRSPHDPGALNNLGNLAMMRGRPWVALALYDRAAAGDTSDAGIVLNQATALMLVGDEEEAQATASSGLAMAGGFRAAAGLLGIATAPELESGAAAKAGRRPGAQREEMLLLLRIAAGKVPADSIRAGGVQKLRPRSPTLRSAGPRGGADNEAPAAIYWRW